MKNSFKIFKCYFFWKSICINSFQIISRFSNKFIFKSVICSYKQDVWIFIFFFYLICYSKCWIYMSCCSCCWYYNFHLLFNYPSLTAKMSISLFAFYIQLIIYHILHIFCYYIYNLFYLLLLFYSIFFFNPICNPWYAYKKSKCYKYCYNWWSTITKKW